jgi:hypothetical protein
MPLAAGLERYIASALPFFCTIAQAVAALRDTGLTDCGIRNAFASIMNG